ncbi:FtsX-like permease family protein, partial [candidate division KSB1 bacterium]|nr:FtsX-like permease family protein [candidate division KSB1 bacterium]NIR72124.1 FtsX-like permease family protein [candidate division KSB1 bacterium]NIS24361.1 FtsX-like permease family protein [candidate division KSB1 bacterium]NIT71293.1 FtsX-like permease family protein [candidate division KSB1 bacterium]NIU24994.1 FtsX-like permease family protein [candidate division KSB1 bacterium]
MLKNYLKVTLNNLSKNKVNSFINITGLAIGIASCILILLYVVRELSYDNYHQELDQLHRVAILDTPDNLGQGIASISYPAAEVLTEEFPEVEQVARLGQLFDQDPAIEIDDRLFAEDRFYFADNSVFELLTIPFLKGDSETALSAPNSIVLSEETARKYFGNIDVVGKTLLVNFNNMSTDYQITGVVRNAPENTHFKYDVFASLDNIFNGLPAGFADAMKSWYMYRFWTYVKLTPGTDAQAFEAKLKHIEQKYFPPTRSNVHLFLQPVKDIHLHSNLNNEVEPNNDIRYIYIFSGIAILVLVIACINFMNLTTARSINRAREVGMRKVLGAHRSQLMSQFTIESLLVTALSVLVAFGLVELLTNVLNDLTGLQLETNYLQSAWLPIGFVFLTLIVGLLSGLYPAFFLSAFQPVKTLKGAFARSSSGAGLRKALVIAQMAITVILLVGIVT